MVHSSTDISLQFGIRVAVWKSIVDILWVVLGNYRDCVCSRKILGVTREALPALQIWTGVCTFPSGNNVMFRIRGKERMVPRDNGLSRSSERRSLYLGNTRLVEMTKRECFEVSYPTSSRTIANNVPGD